MDVNSGFILATTLTFASEHDSKYLLSLTIASCHTKDPIEKVYADKGYLAPWNNRSFKMHCLSNKARQTKTPPLALSLYSTG